MKRILMFSLIIAGAFFIAEYSSAKDWSCAKPTGECVNLEAKSNELSSNVINECNAKCDTGLGVCDQSRIKDSACTQEQYYCVNCGNTCHRFDDVSSQNAVSRCATADDDCKLLNNTGIEVAKGNCEKWETNREYHYSYFSSSREDCYCQSKNFPNLDALIKAMQDVDMLPCDKNPIIWSESVDYSQRFAIGRGSCPGVSISNNKQYYCRVVSDFDKFKRGDCRQFMADGKSNAIDEARRQCTQSSDEAVQIFEGTCPNDQDPGALTTDQLQTEAEQKLNKANLGSVTELINRTIKLLFAFVGMISLVMYILAGVLWMTAGGNAERVGSSKKILVWTTLGIVVMFFSYVLVNFIFQAIA